MLETKMVVRLQRNIIEVMVLQDAQVLYSYFIYVIFALKSNTSRFTSMSFVVIIMFYVLDVDPDFRWDWYGNDGLVVSPVRQVRGTQVNQMTAQMTVNVCKTYCANLELIGRGCRNIEFCTVVDAC